MPCWNHWLRSMLHGGSTKQFKKSHKNIHKLLGVPKHWVAYILANLAWCSLVTITHVHPHQMHMPSSLPYSCTDPWALKPVENSHQHIGKRCQRGAVERNLYALNMTPIAAPLKRQSMTCGKNKEFLSLKTLYEYFRLNLWNLLAISYSIFVIKPWVSTTGIKPTFQALDAKWISLKHTLDCKGSF